MFLVDSHCHLDILNYKSLHKNLDDVLTKAVTRDVKFFLTVSTSISNYFDIRKVICDRNNVVYSCGVHPLNQEKYEIETLYNLAKSTKVVAIGETGLDYFYSPNNKDNQQMSFRIHIDIGRKLNKPLIIHTRNAINDTLTILKTERIIDCGGVLHCFSEDKKVISKLLDLGIYISFSGIVTFRNAEKLRDALQYVPLDYLLLETDSPYLAPVPYRGKENQPALLKDIAEYIAKLKKTEISKLAQITTQNFINLFHLKLTI